MGAAPNGSICAAWLVVSSHYLYLPGEHAGWRWAVRMGRGRPVRSGHGDVACRSQGCHVDRGAEALRHAMVHAEAA